MSQALALKSSTPTSSPASSLTCCDARSDSVDADAYSPGKESERFPLRPKDPGPWTNPGYKHPHAVLLQHRGRCGESLVDHQLSPSEGLEIFCRGTQALPDSVLRSVIFEKYALAERSRLQILVATWDLEATKRRVFAQQEILHHLEAAHCLNESEFKYWLSLYTDRGLSRLTTDVLFYGHHLTRTAQETDLEVAELTVMIDHARGRGLNVDSFDWPDESGLGEDAVGFGDGADLG